MTFEEMVTYLLETYPSDRYRGDELMDYITAEIKAAEARGAITPEVRERVYVMLWKIRGGARCGAAAAQGHLYQRGDADPMSSPGRDERSMLSFTRP